MALKFSEVGRLLFDEISTQLKDLDFKSRWSHRDFVRKEEWGRSGFHLFYYTYPDRLGVSGELTLRIDEVQKLTEPYFFDMEPKYVKESPTLSIEIAYHLKFDWKSLVLWGVDDIPAAASELTRIVRDVAEPFYDKYHLVSEAYNLLRSDDPRNQAYSSLASSRGMKLVAMARILGREGDIPGIAEEYRAKIVAAKEEHYLSQFEALLAAQS